MEAMAQVDGVLLTHLPMVEGRLFLFANSMPPSSGTRRATGDDGGTVVRQAASLRQNAGSC